MHILIAPDSFKESLSALEVAKAVQKGFRKLCQMRLLMSCLLVTVVKELWKP